MTDPQTSLLVQSERELLAWYQAERQRIARLPAAEQAPALARVTRALRRELMSR